MNRRRICHLITTLGSGGAESMLFRIVAEASRTSHFEHFVISLTDEGVFGKGLSDSGIVVHSLRMQSGRISPGAIARLHSILRTENPAILMTWLYHADFLGLLVGRAAGIRHIVWNIRTSKLDFKIYRGSIKYVFEVNRWLSRYPNLVIYNSIAGRRDHEIAGFQPKRSLYLPNGFDLGAFKPNCNARSILRKSLQLDESVLLVGMVARYDPVKGHSDFLAAAGEISKVMENVHFVLVGKDSSGQLRTVVENSGLSNRIHLLGERKDMAEITAGLDLATLTSSFGEGFPNVLGEAMACGIPCVSTDVGDASIVIGKHGIIVPPRDVNGLMRAWQSILALSPAERRSKGLEARKHIEENFSLPLVAARYERLFCELSAE